MVSVPLLVYRLFMLAWALWLALALLRWARWIWDCFTQGGLWRSWPRRMPPALPTPYPDANEPAPDRAE